jgi:hypothetical protein
MAHRISSFLLIALVAAVGAVALATWYRQNSPVQTPVAGTPVATAPSREPSGVGMVQVADSAAVSSQAATVTVERLIADTTSADAAKRAAAIAALAEAPREEAVPALRRILTSGEPEVDRSLALRALRDVALNQGDADGKVRDAVRHAIYHGDDFTKTAEVQDVLDVIEESELSASQR